MSFCATGLLTRGYVVTCVGEVIVKEGLTSCKVPKQQSIVEVRPRIRRTEITIPDTDTLAVVSVVPITLKPLPIAPPITSGEAPKPIGSSELVPKIVKAEEE